MEINKLQKITEEFIKLDHALEVIIQGVEEEERNRGSNINKYKRTLEMQNNIEV